MDAEPSIQNRNSNTELNETEQTNTETLKQLKVTKCWFCILLDDIFVTLTFLQMEEHMHKLNSDLGA